MTRNDKRYQVSDEAIRTLVRCSILFILTLSGHVGRASASGNPSGERIPGILEVGRAIKTTKITHPEVLGLAAGAYSRIGQITNRVVIHLFPNNTAMIEQCSDVSISTVVAFGHWDVEDSSISISWNKLRFQNDFERSLFVKTYGPLNKLFGYILSRDGLPPVFLLLPTDADPNLSYTYLVRQSEYNEWKDVEQRLKSSATEIVSP